MKKYWAILLVLVMIVTMLPTGLAVAAEDPDPDEPVISEPDPEDPDPDELIITEPDPEDPEPGEDPGLLPDSFFYIFKRLIENIRVWFTFKPEKKTALLAELVEKRAAELDALEEKFSSDLSERQLEILQEATKGLEKAAENLFETLLGDGSNLEDLELTEEGLSRLETALVNLGLAFDRIMEAENPEESPADPEEPGDDAPKNQEQKRLRLREKYEQRIQHLEQIRDRNPESCAKGLNRAIENARRQQDKWDKKLDKKLKDGEPEAEKGKVNDPGKGSKDRDKGRVQDPKSGCKDGEGDKNRDKDRNENPKGGFKGHEDRPGKGH